jgi:hypothetical protein
LDPDWPSLRGELPEGLVEADLALLGAAVLKELCFLASADDELWLNAASVAGMDSVSRAGAGESDTAAVEFFPFVRGFFFAFNAAFPFVTDLPRFLAVLEGPLCWETSSSLATDCSCFLDDIARAAFVRLRFDFRVG